MIHSSSSSSDGRMNWNIFLRRFGLAYEMRKAMLLFVHYCRLLISFANSLDPGQARQKVGPDLEPKLFDTQMVFLKDFFEKKKTTLFLINIKSADDKNLRTGRRDGPRVCI